MKISQINNRNVNFTAGKTKILSDFDGTFMPKEFEHDVICTVRDVLEKIVTDYAILPTRPNMDEVKRALTIMENHSVVQRIEGRLNQTSCKFAIMPTILSVVPSDKLDAIVRTLRKEDDDEEVEEDIVD